MKCTPIVVTGKKIISLKAIKGKLSDDESKVTNSPSKPDIVEDTKNTAVVKPLPVSRPIFDDIDEKLERELLEEESTTPPPPVPEKNVVTSSKRRVVIRDEEDEEGGDANVVSNKRSLTDDEKTDERKLRIFERLDRKPVLGNESKRKIQRIVVKNSN